MKNLSSRGDMKIKEKYELVEMANLMLLQRNPQYLTPKQMEALKKSIEKDGFLAPILVRPKGKKFEVISGNHRFLAAQELKLEKLPVIIKDMDDQTAKKLAMNLNMIHGEPPAELVAPFLADLTDEVLRQIHFEKDFLREIIDFDEILKRRLEALEIPEGYDNASPLSTLKKCECPKCGRVHFEK